MDFNFEQVEEAALTSPKLFNEHEPVRKDFMLSTTTDRIKKIKKYALENDTTVAQVLNTYIDSLPEK